MIINTVSNQKFQKYNHQATKKTTPSFGSESERFVRLRNFFSSAFKTGKRDYVYGGAFIQEKEEFDFLTEEIGIRSILTFLNPEREYDRKDLVNEIKFINQYNNKYPENKIVFDSLPCLSNASAIRANPQKYKEALIEKINKLPPPIYMHCYTGDFVTFEMMKLFKEAFKEGKIVFRNE